LVGVNDRTAPPPSGADGRLPIGALARRTGLPVSTIRYWSDRGVVTPVGRSAGGYRLYDAAALARLELIRTLRDLGLGLADIQAVLSRQATVAEVAHAHVRALDAEIRLLQLRRAVLRSVARRGGTTEEMTLMHRLARLTAAQRQRLIDEFVAETFDGVAPGAPGGHIAAAMRDLPDLPEEPGAAQVDAWVELAELVADPDFRARVREMAVHGAQPDAAAPGPAPDPAEVTRHAGEAVAAGVDPASPAARDVLARLVPADLSPAQRAELADGIARFTDRRVERYWQLLGVLHGRPPFPSAVPAYEWLIAALRAA